MGLYREAFHEELEKLGIPKESILDFKIVGNDVSMRMPQGKMKVKNNAYLVMLAKMAKEEPLDVVESDISREMFLRRLWGLEHVLHKGWKTYRRFTNDLRHFPTTEIKKLLDNAEKAEEEKITTGRYRDLAILTAYTELVKKFGSRSFSRDDFLKVSERWTMEDLLGVMTYVNSGGCDRNILGLFGTPEGREALIYFDTEL